MSRRFADAHGETSGLREEMSRQFADAHTETNSLREEMSRRFEQVNTKVDRHFTWLVGLQVTSLLAVMSAIAGLYLR